ncbi:MAG: glycosyltransferase [Actinomycetes bacterium]
MIERVGVVVPARDEQDLLPRCLDALSAAIDHLTRERALPVVAVVVLDSCTDESRSIVADREWVTGVCVDAGNVGVARAAGCVEVLRGQPADRLRTCWLASTNADSEVPVDWLTRQIDLADSGAEVVLGTVAVQDWSEHATHVAGRWQASYDARDGHRHVHGANVGCRADAYLEAGGFPALSSDEDVALVAALAGRTIVATGLIPVVTSARRNARAGGGFAGYLAQLG